ncbi:MAG: glycoside hydrolase domain-containing protein [Spirillospora sp.]
MSVFGVDYAWGRPGASALKRAGAKYACRYLSHDKTGKNLTRAEADDLSEAGIWLVVVWETTAKRPLDGRSAGAADAEDAAAQAKACGMPGARPIYFAADWDATRGQQDEINAYLDGAASVIGRDRVGLYGGHGPVKRAFDAEKITYGWQTYAWSGGKWDDRAQLQQYSNDHEINGVGVDYNRAVRDDYGQWRVGVTP